MFNRWIHICQAMDFNNYQITTVVNGEIGWPGNNNFTKNFVQDGETFKNPLRRNETLKDKFAIGVSVDWYYNTQFNDRGGNWIGK